MSEEENRVYFSKKDITFYGDTEKEKKLNERLFDDSLLIAQKDDEIKDLQNQLQQKENIIKEVRNCIKEESWFCYKDNEEIIDRTPVNKLLEILDKENK